MASYCTSTQSLQIASHYSAHLFSDELYLYDRAQKNSYIRLGQVEKAILMAMNAHHVCSIVWAVIKSEFCIPDDDPEAATLFDHFLSVAITGGLLVEGDQTMPVFGESGKAFPAFVSMELTDCCNFKCGHCYKNACAANSHFIDTQHAIDILSQLSGKVYSLDLTGGEATLHPDFDKIVASVQNVGRLCLLTNGSTLSSISEETIRSFKEIQITLYGNSHETYAEFTNTALFDKVCTGIKRVVHLGIHCTVALQLRPDIIDNLQNYVSLIAGLGVRRIRFGMVQKLGRNISNEDWDTSVDDFNRFTEAMTQVKQLFPDIEFQEPQWDDTELSALNTAPTRIACSAGTRSIVISEQAKIRPCIYIPQKYFEKITWFDYYDKIASGGTYDFNFFFPQCIADLSNEGRNILSICSHGFE